MNWVYENAVDNTARYTLGTVGERSLVCIGLNPSTAVPGRLDPTLRRVQAVADLNHYDSFLMLNVYPLRSTDPEGLPIDLDPEAVHANTARISAALEGTTPDVWVAWGALIAKRHFLVPLLLDLLDLPVFEKARWLSHGPVSKDGHPHHPLYVKDTDPLDPFDMSTYRKKLRLL